jgi:hypothetical protein
MGLIPYIACSRPSCQQIKEIVTSAGQGQAESIFGSFRAWKITLFPPCGDTSSCH